MAGAIPRWKGMIYAGAFGAVTFVGTIYGAGLKTQQEYKAERKMIVESTPESKIAILEDRRRALVTQKTQLEKKLAALDERIRNNQKKEEDGNGR